MPVMPALRRMRQEDYMFKVSLSYTVRPCLAWASYIVRPYLKNKQGWRAGSG